MCNKRMLPIFLAMACVAAWLGGCGGPVSTPPDNPNAEVEVQEPPPEEPATESVQPPAESAQPEETPSGMPAESLGESPATYSPARDAGSPGEPGWITLFNGTDLTGWRNARDPEGENRWLVEDGTLTNEEHANDIATLGQWKDFDLSLQYKIVEGGNSGVYLRGRVEIQILDSYGKENLEPSDNGGIYGQFAPRVNASRPAGEWNTLDARYVGDRLTVMLNGQVVLDDVPITEVTGGALPGGVDDPGPLMLQGDHGKVWFRDIRLRSLDPAGTPASPEEGAAPQTSDQPEQSEQPE